MTIPFIDPREQFLDGNGDPFSGGTLTFYKTGTSTKLDTYSDSTRTTANSNPVVLDSAGRLPNAVYLLNQDYKVVLKASDGSTVWTQDPVVPPAGSFATLVADKTFTGDGSTTTFDLGVEPPNGNGVIAAIDGVLQNPDNYSISGTNVVFDTAPPNGSDVNLRNFGYAKATPTAEANSVTYTGDFSGAVGVTLRDELDLRAITPQMFGGVGDYDPDAATGTDDTSALRAALDASPSVVFLPDTGAWYGIDGTISDEELFRCVGPGKIYRTTNGDFIGAAAAGGIQKDTGHAGGLLMSPNWAFSPAISPNDAYRIGGAKLDVIEYGFTRLTQLRRGTPGYLSIVCNAVRIEGNKNSGTNQISYQSGDGLGQFFVGLPITLSEQGGSTEEYIVTGNSGPLTVENTDGTSVSFSNSNDVLVYQNFVLGHHRAEVVGNDVFFLRDDRYERPQFVFSGFAITNEHVWIYVNGAWRKVTAVASNPDSSTYWQVLTVDSAPGDATYDISQAHFWDELANLRVKPVDGGGDEAGLDFKAYPDRYVIEMKGKKPSFERPLEVIATEGLKLNPNGGETSVGGTFVNKGERYDGSRQRIADDVAVSFKPDGPIGMLAINFLQNGALLSFNAGGGNVNVIAQVGTTYTGQSGALSGTTGPDNQINIGADSSGNVYVENRTGGNVDIAWSVMANR